MKTIRINSAAAGGDVDVNLTEIRRALTQGLSQGELKTFLTSLRPSEDKTWPFPKSVPAASPAEGFFEDVGDAVVDVASSLFDDPPF